MNRVSFSQLPSPLPLLDRNLLRLAEKVVPLPERAEWSRSWQAELWHRHHRNSSLGVAGKSGDSAADLSIGLIRDALWLRTESWRRAFEGTATACLGSLIVLSSCAVLFGLAYAGHWHALGAYLGSPFKRFLVTAPLVVFVSFANAPRRHTRVPQGDELEAGEAGRTLRWVKRKIFFVTKTALILLLAFLLSADMFQPIHTLWPATTDMMQIFFCVLFAIAALRWVIRDQEERCKHCLRSLAAPARVGRPSYNLLEWNGTELLCKQGHGVLSVPEIETSWCASSQWVSRSACWDQAANV